MSLSTTDYTPRIGTRVDATAEMLLSGRYKAEILDLLDRRGVLVFKELDLSVDEQKAFTKSLGGVELQLGHEVQNVSLDKKLNGALADYLKAAFYWHIDLATEAVPNRASLLTARKLSETGGDTEFASTYAAYEDLPDEEKKAIANIRVVHSFEASQRFIKPEPSYEDLKMWQQFKVPKVHPLVWTHKSGLKSLLLGATASHVVDMPLDEGRLLLAKLRDWTAQPQFVFRHKWNVGDLVMWDNTGTMHRAMDYPEDSGRLMTRTVLTGEEAVA